MRRQGMLLHAWLCLLVMCPVVRVGGSSGGATSTTIQIHEEAARHLRAGRADEALPLLQQLARVSDNPRVFAHMGYAFRMKVCQPQLI